MHRLLAREGSLHLRLQGMQGTGELLQVQKLSLSVPIPSKSGDSRQAKGNEASRRPKLLAVMADKNSPDLSLQSESKSSS